ncbi:ubiquitin carboxyl-terminal hydrolase 2-like isoform X2 [Acanthaster planci]|uniref:Ubiquitin carboxyl-terminal hydrolase n=1 Tax=Acanthaster planci TaxID=133434 RepID=A0A8B8A0K7_ACAPL|nr:ubiquitin carboxyl-terminal hydrolase 2-like isoform X2 [Acanthaster planci]
MREVDKKLAKRAAKRAARAEAARKEKERLENIRCEKERKERLKEARKQRKEAAKLEKLEKKKQRKAKKIAKEARRAEENLDPIASNGKGDSISKREKEKISLYKSFGCQEKVADTSPVSAPSKTSIHPYPSAKHRSQSPPSGSPKIPPGSPHFQAALIQTVPDDGEAVIHDAIPSVETPLSTGDDVAGMSYRAPAQRHSPVTVQRRSSSRPSSPARLVTPSSVTRLSPPAVSRTPHPPGGYSRTDYVPSVSRTCTSSRRSGILDDSPAEKSRFSRYGGTDINANSRIDPLSKLYGSRQASPAKIPQQTRQQPVRAVHPSTETVSKSSKLSHRYSNHRNYSTEDDLNDDVINLHINDTSGSLSPASTTSSRRSSFTMGQRSRGSSSDLRCPPIPGASPPTSATTPKVTRRVSGSYNTEYKPTFVSNASRPPPTTNGPKVPSVSRTKASSILEESNSEKVKEEEPLQSAFSSAEHSVLGTGRTGNTYNGKSVNGGMIGLANLGNTCYMNSILQCLAQNKDLREYFLTNTYLDDINRRSPRQGTLVKSFAEVMKEIWNPKYKSVVTPNSLQLAFQRIAKHFGPGKQQDAQEFLCYFLCELHDETNTAPRKRGSEPDIPDDISEDAKAKLAWGRYCAHNNSIFSRLFVGQLKSTLECQTCRNRSVTFDIFWDISLPVPEVKSYQRRASWERDNQSVKHSFDIKDCLNKFTEAEVLDGDNMVTCEKCKKKRVFTKTFSIQRFPKHLVLHLKRFSGLRAKLTTFVDFPLTGLDMSRYLADSAADTGLLNLTTAINHIEPLSHDLFYLVWKMCGTPPVVSMDEMLSLQDQKNNPSLDQLSSQYNLGGVSQHSGSMLGGHYIAYAKHLQNKKWHCYDDTRVDSINEKSVPSSYAYVLFYEQANQP